MSGNRSKTAFALECSIRELCRKNPLAISGSATFAENVSDIKEAHRRWRNLLERIRRRLPHISVCGVWERQERGSWHVHYVASSFIDVNWLRPVAIECGFGPQMRLQPVVAVKGFRGLKGTNLSSVDTAVRYCCKYLTKQVEEYAAGERLVFYHGRSRAASTRFKWVGGMSKLFRIGRQAYSEVFGTLTHKRLSYVMPLVMRMGWELLSDDERWDMLNTSDVVRRWWFGDEYDQFIPF